MPKQRYSDEANKTYTYPVEESLLDHQDDILKFVEHHRSNQLPRLKDLLDYYLGKNTTILEDNRRKEKNKADNRATHNFAKYVSNFMQGFFVGVPIAMNHEKDSINQKIVDINGSIEANTLNSEIELDCSIFGRAYELLHRNQKDKTMSYLMTPKETFVVYDDTIEQEPLAGIRYRDKTVNEESVTFIEVYTDREVVVFKVTKDSLKEVSRETHGFGAVPINEYQNNRFRQGDYENVLDLIDLYDGAQSDLANYSQDLQDALLKIVGDVEMSVEEAKQQKDANVIFVKPSVDSEGKVGSADADYIYKQYDVQGMEAYKDRLQTDIHKFTFTPDLSDANFSGSQTGEALKYKLFGLEQLRIVKERMFKRSLARRYELISNIGNLVAELDQSLDDIEYTFTPNLPKSVTDAVANFKAVGGELSDETKLKLIPMLVENPKEELERIQEEDADIQKRASDFMGGEN